MKKILNHSFLVILLTLSLLGFLGFNVFVQESSQTEISMEIENGYFGVILEDPENPGQPYYRGINITKADGSNLPNRTKPFGFNNIPGSFGDVTRSMEIKIQIVGLKYNHTPNERQKCLISLIDSSSRVIPNSFATHPYKSGTLTQVVGNLGKDGIAPNESYQWYECSYTGFIARDFPVYDNLRARFSFISN